MMRQVSSHGGVPTSGLDRQEEGQGLEGWPQGGSGRSASLSCLMFCHAVIHVDCHVGRCILVLVVYCTRYKSSI